MTRMLEGKIALVSGGRARIGRATCERLRREGATVLAGNLIEDGSFSPRNASSGTFVSLDVTSEEEVRAAMLLTAR